MTAIVVFPGQGAQSVGMGKALCDAYPAARDVFAAVDEALGEPLSRMVFEGPIEALTLTENAQPALMAKSLAALRALEAVSGRKLASFAGYVAGHSLGEYAALTAAGALDLGDAARLLRLRGRAMQDAAPVGVGAMAAILGLDAASVEAAAAEAEAEGGVCALANDNADGQAVLSGDRAAVERAMALAKAKGAKRAIMLQVSAPFHCALMAPAAERLAAALRETRFRPPAAPLIANVTAEAVSDPTAIRELLERQVTGRVRWRESMGTMRRLGVNRMIEFGAGRVLTGLARRDLEGAALVNVQEPKDVEALAAALVGTQSHG
jgi:[acyl-carrier-protein] S-malonyltransferase